MAVTSHFLITGLDTPSLRSTVIIAVSGTPHGFHAPTPRCRFRTAAMYPELVSAQHNKIGQKTCSGLHADCSVDIIPGLGGEVGYRLSRHRIAAVCPRV